MPSLLDLYGTPVSTSVGWTYFCGLPYHYYKNGKSLCGHRRISGIQCIFLDDCPTESKFIQVCKVCKKYTDK